MARLPEDLTTFLVTVDRLEYDHRLPVVDNALRPTVPFLEALAEVLDSTPTGAWHAWMLAGLWRAEVSQQHEQAADLAFWFGINPFSLDRTQQAGLTANLPRVKAQSILHHGNYRASDYERVFALVLLATGDEAQARRARGDAIEALMDERAS